MTLVDRVHAKFLESDLTKRGEHKDKMEKLEEKIAQKKLGNLESQGALLTKLTR